MANVITNKDVPPALIVLGEKALATSGRLGETVSMSATVQVPATQVSAAFVFDKPTGTEIEAVLVICVCEKANCGMARESKKPNTSDNMLNALVTDKREKVKRLNTLAITDKRTPNTYIVVLICILHVNCNTIV